MGKYRTTIERGYQVYLDEYPDYQLVSVGDWDYPLQGAVLEENMSNVRISNARGPLEDKCLVQHRDDVPEVSELPMDDLAWLPIGLTDVLKVQRAPDHDALWKTTANLLPHLNSEDDFLPEELVRNFETLVRAVLCSSWEPSSTDNSDWSDQANENHLFKEASVLGRYMAFPTLEGIVKCLMKRDVTLDGIVRPGQEIISYSGDDYTEGCQVNVLGHLLWHFEQVVADNTLQRRLVHFRDSIECFFQIEDNSNLEGYGFLSNQRNSILHGQMQAKAEFGILLNLISLLLLNIDHIPEEKRIPPP